MRTVELPFTGRAGRPAVEQRVEAAAKRAECASTAGTLRSYPGSVHWHFRRPKESGTLELTWWPKGKLFWIKVASNREADWIEDAIAVLVREFGIAEIP